jgi:hypothetical protein
MKKIYPSKAAKRKAEYERRKANRANERRDYTLRDDETIEEMAKRLGIRLN